MGFVAPSAAAAPHRSPLVVPLDAELAQDPRRAGMKAAALSRASAAGVRVVPGVVLTTAFGAAVEWVGTARDTTSARQAFDLVDGGRNRLIVRSSSLVEDTAASSMAGRFATVSDVVGEEEFFVAVERVLQSAQDDDAGRSMAVLVQHMLEPAVSGVMFGIDPTTGRGDRVVVGAVTGRPHPLMEGTAAGSRYELSRDGKVVRFVEGDGPALPRRELRRLVSLEARCRELFGSPQDIEWAIDAAGSLWLLQSRPVTSRNRGSPRGPVYGPGPVAETFPDPLSRLEVDLWVPPLKDAVREVARLTGTAWPRDLARSEIVVVVDGAVAIDLHLAGEVPTTAGWWRWIDLRPALRRAIAAWRLGRLRRALPLLAESVLDRVDADLQDVPDLAELTDSQLVVLLRRSAAALRSLHAHEMLMGSLIDRSTAPTTGAALALRMLQRARAEGLDDAAIVERNPVVLLLAPPRIGPAPALPTAVIGAPEARADHGGDQAGVLREALRLRVRWVQELSARAAWELGRRLKGSDQLAAVDDVRHVPLEQLAVAVATRAVPEGARPPTPRPGAVGPVPARFQLTEFGLPVAVESGRSPPLGTAAGAPATVTGPVTRDRRDPPPGSVLVTVTFRPELAPLLPRLAAIIAETGSPLSHLAILARETGVPAVVGYREATSELQPGALVTVHGSTGEVTFPMADPVP